MSWVVVDITTGQALFETFQASLVAKLNPERAKAVPIKEYLYDLNDKIKRKARQ